MKYFDLYNGNNLPAVGLGVYTLENEPELRKVMIAAHEANYELIDTAYFYKNEEFIGEIIQSEKLNKFKIASKVWPSDFGADATKRSIERSLKSLRTDCLEIMYLHWPGEDSEQSWKVLEDYYEQGVFKNIGVCNFYKHHLDKLSVTANIKPHVDQIETHPLLTLNNFIDYLKKENIQPIAWSPLARANGELFNDQNVLKLAKKYDVSVGQIVLKYNIARDVIVLPRTTKEKRVIENIDLFNFELSKEDFELLDSLNIDKHVSHSPDETDWLKEIRKK